MSVTNVITVTFGSSTLVFTEPYYKYNSGMYLLFSDLDLPTSYQVHFANSTSGDSLESIGDADGVLIPDDVWQTGATIYAWVYLHPTDGSAVTKYEVRIPVSGRADLPDGTEPTPSEQTVIDQAITALNNAVAQTAEDVEQTETNVTHYPKIEDGTWRVWDAENGAWVDTEITAEGQDGKGIASIAKTSTVGLVDTYTITFTDGTTTTYTVTNGQDGDVGATPNLSIGTVTTLEPTESATATITGTDENPVLNLGIPKGADGTDGISPTVTITPITGGHRITITDADGSHSADVINGDDYTLTAQDKQDIAELVDVPVDDVQINGTSIVENGVANVPIASDGVLGAVKTENTGYYGLTTNSAGRIVLNPASQAQMKAGTGVYRPIVSSEEHTATFYGLAKASGDTTQASSSNAVGTYTDSAIDSIMFMLGIDDLIAPHESAQASQAYAVGACFIYNGKLYKATSAIASGDAITPDTNCTQTTLVELINS